MAWWDELGATLPAQEQQQKPEVSGANTWTNWLQNPVNQAGLLSFGLQMMSGGGHGGQSFGQELATGLGHGFAGASATDAAIRKQQELDEEQARKTHEGEADRSQRMEIAKMQIASREEVAREKLAGMLQGIGMRNEGALARAQLPGGGKGQLTDNQALIEAWRRHKARTNMSFENATDEDIEQVKAEAAQIKQQGLGAPAAAPGGAAPAAGGAAPAAKAVPGGLEQALKKPAIAKALESEAGQAELRRKGFGSLVDEYLARK